MKKLSILKRFGDALEVRFRIVLFFIALTFFVTGSYGQCSEGIEIRYFSDTPCGGNYHNMHVGVTGFQANDDLDFHLYQKLETHWQLVETKPNWGVPIDFNIYIVETSHFGFMYTNRVTGCNSSMREFTLTPVQMPPTPTGIAAESNKLCAGEKVTLTAEMPSDPNATGITPTVRYLWQYSKDGGTPVALPSTTANTTDFDLPAFPSGGEIVFSVRVQNIICSEHVTPTLSTAQTVLPPAPLAPDLKLCMDGSTGTLVLTTVPGGNIGDEYAFGIENGPNYGPRKVGEVIGAVSNYSSLPYTLYRYAERPDGGAEGCGVFGTTPVINVDSLTVTATATCTSGLTAMATGPGSITGFSYSKDGGNTYQTANTFNNLTPGNYFIKARDAHGCVGRTGTVSVFAPLSSTVDPKLACPGGDNGAITINASGGQGPFEYSVDGGSTLQSANAFSGLTANTYAVFVKDTRGAGCTLTQSYSLGNSPAINISSVTPVSPKCKGEANGSISVTASQGTSPLEYSIGSAYQSESAFTNLVAGTYTVTIRDGNDCMKSFSPVNVIDPAALVFTSITATPRSCAEKTDGAISVVAVGGTGNREYSIDGFTYVDENSPTGVESDPTRFSGLSSGVYTITVMDDNACTAIASSPFVGVKPAIDGTITVEEVISCFGANDGVLKTAPSGGTAPYTIAWSNSLSTNINPNLGPGTYSVVITDAQQCERTFEQTLIEPQLLAASAVTTDVACFGGDDGSIDLMRTGGTAPFVYTWSNGADSEDIGDLQKGSYGVTITDAHACAISVNDLLVAEPPVVTLEIDSIKNISCNGGNNGVVGLLAGGGVGMFEYSLDLSIWQNTNLFDGLAAGDYTVYVRDANLCSINRNTSLSEPSPLTLAVAEHEETSCGEANGFATVAASGGVPSYRYEWRDAANGLISTNEQATSLRSGDYRAVVYDSHSCVSDIQVTINDSNGPVVQDVLITGLTCFESNDGAISVGVTGGQAPYDIAWDTQATNVTAISNVTGGEHWIEIFDANSCRTKEFFRVDFPDPIEVEINATAPSCYGNTDGQIQALVTGGNSGGYEYLWASGETNPSISNLPKGTYSLTVKDTKLCAAHEEIVLEEPPLFEIDAGGNRTICVGQVVNISAPEDNATYLWTSDKGFNSSDREVQLSIPATYTLQVIDVNGCSAADSFVLDASTDLLQADFLSTDEAFAGDTIVLVEISWPIPENITWNFPLEATIISQEDAYAEIVFANSGTYNVVLNTFLGECIDEYAKQITILGERPDAGGRTGNGLVHTFEVHPNPSDGWFIVSIGLNEIVDGRLMMVGLSGNATLFSVPLDGRTDIRYEANVADMPAGFYFLILEAGKKKLIKRLIIR